MTEVPVLDIHRLTVRYGTEDGPLLAVNDVSMKINVGQAVGIVGEFGIWKKHGSRGRTGSARFGCDDHRGLNPV